MRSRLSFILALGITFGVRLQIDETRFLRGDVDRTGRPQLRDFARRAVGRQTYGIYLGAKRFGWSLDEREIVRDGDRDIFRRKEEMRIKGTVFGEVLETTWRRVMDFSLEGEGLLLAARVESSENGRLTTISGRRERGEEPPFVITTTFGDEQSERRVAQPKATLKGERDADAWLKKGPKKGDEFVGYDFDIEQDQVDVRSVVVYRGKRKLLRGGVQTDAYNIVLRQQGMRVSAVVLASGFLLEGAVGGVFRIRAEEESIAKALGRPIDFGADLAIKADRDLGDPADVVELTLEVRGHGDFRFPTSERQRVRTLPDSTAVLDLSGRRAATEKEPLSLEERRQYLASTANFDSEHPRLSRRARKIIGDTKSARERGKRLVEWIYKNLRGSSTSNATVASQVLATGAGDCTEHALLLVAFARAVGIPARTVGGLMFVNHDGQPIFVAHEWAEIHDGDRWLSVDPAWNQVDVDATHIKLSEGTRDFAWINLLGQLELKVLDVQRKGENPAPTGGGGMCAFCVPEIDVYRCTNSPSRARRNPASMAFRYV